MVFTETEFVNQTRDKLIWNAIAETWLTGNVSDQKIVGDVTPAGYSFHHASRIHKKESAFFSVIL